MTEFEEKSRWTQYGRELAAAVMNGTELPKAEWDRNCHLNKTANYRKAGKDSNADVLIHLNDEGINKKAVVEAIASFLNMTEDEAKLMLFYSDCSTGFRPALKVIIDSTGIDKRQICRTKNSLISKNIIDWQEGRDKKCHLNKDDRIVIDWRKLSAVAFASLESDKNDNHRYYRDGKRVRQSIKKNLGTVENRLLWDNKPSTLWAEKACVSRQRIWDNPNLYSADDYTAPIGDMLDWQLELEPWANCEYSDYEVVDDGLPF